MKLFRLQLVVSLGLVQALIIYKAYYIVEMCSGITWLTLAGFASIIGALTMLAMVAETKFEPYDELEEERKKCKEARNRYHKLVDDYHKALESTRD